MNTFCVKYLRMGGEYVRLEPLNSNVVVLEMEKPRRYTSYTSAYHPTIIGTTENSKQASKVDILLPSLAMDTWMKHVSIITNYDQTKD